MPAEMKPHKRIQIVDLLCTPQDLRDLADRAEKHLREIKLGDSVLVEYIHGDKVTIAVMLDQDRV